MDEPANKPPKPSVDQVKQATGAAVTSSEKKKGKDQQEFLIVKLADPL